MLYIYKEFKFIDTINNIYILKQIKNLLISVEQKYIVQYTMNISMMFIVKITMLNLAAVN